MKEYHHTVQTACNYFQSIILQVLHENTATCGYNDGVDVGCSATRTSETRFR